jgi:hypothetical protein
MASKRSFEHELDLAPGTKCKCHAPNCFCMNVMHPIASVSMSRVESKQSQIESKQSTKRRLSQSLETTVDRAAFAAGVGIGLGSQCEV